MLDTREEENNGRIDLPPLMLQLVVYVFFVENWILKINEKHKVK